MEKTSTIGTRIKQQRVEQGTTLQQIADAVGIAKSTVQRYETDRIEMPKQPVVAAIAKVLCVNPAWLMGESDEKFPPSTLENASLADVDFTYALYNEAAPLTSENRAKLMEMARFFKEQQKKEQGR